MRSRSTVRSAARGGTGRSAARGNVRDLVRGTLRSTVVAAAALPMVACGLTAAWAAHPVPDPSVFLAVTGGHGGWIRSVRLQCRPAPHGQHPHAAQACAELGDAGGLVDALDPGGDHCRDARHDPVSASAQGAYTTRVAVHWSRDFPSLCALRAATGELFDF